MDPGDRRATRPAARFPRERGDGPSSTHALMPSPVGFPASAGMDPLSAFMVFGAPGFPRERGDGPHARAVVRSPHRGFPASAGMDPTRPTATPGGRGFPASAGMDPRQGGHTSVRGGFPRERGDGPAGRKDCAPLRAVSSRARGWTRCPGPPTPQRHGFPASAGMDLGTDSILIAYRRFPRERGDGPERDGLALRLAPVFPRARGWTRSIPASAGHGPGFPASAGMDPSASSPAHRWPRFPRERGDGPSQELPPARRAGGFPASAGMDRPPASRPWRSCRFPRERGDGPESPYGGSQSTAVSPRARGWTRGDRRDRAADYGFPASAGMDPRPGPAPCIRSWFPRERGDRPATRTRSRDVTSVSPRGRGWNRAGPPRPGARGSFPASAGMDPSEPTPRLG